MRLPSLLALLALPLLTACAGYEIRHAKLEAPRAPKTLPLSAAVASSETPWTWHGAGGSWMITNARWKPVWERGNGANAFAKALQESGAFRTADLVTRRDGHDLVFDGRFTGDYRKDPSLGPKAFLTGFLMFLPASFFTYDDPVKMTGEVAVYDRGGRLLARYNESADVVRAAKIFSDGGKEPIIAAVEAASRDLALKLAAAVVADQDALAAKAKAGADAPKPEPVAAAPVPAPAPAVVAAAAPAAPAPPPAREEPVEPELARAARPKLTRAQVEAELLP